MRKIIIGNSGDQVRIPNLDFLPLERLAQVEFSSEASGYSVEAALLPADDSNGGWRAASAGEQTLRLIFDQPQTLNHIVLLFEESEISRTQEFVLMWLPEGEKVYCEILRQQFNFSPPGTVREFEHYRVELKQLKALELKIIPDIGGGSAYAKLKQLRLA